MAELADGRLYKRKRLSDPTNQSTYLFIPVIYRAEFKLMADQAQEFFVYFDNSINSSRKTHVKRVTNNMDSSQYIDVERIDEWNVKIMQDQAQESTFVLTNTDPPPIQADGQNSPAHEQVHYVRFFKNNDINSDTWCDVELIDELKIKCMAEQAQEYFWFLRHPELGESIDDPDVPYALTKGFCDPALELATADEGLDPPYRLDVFQNIINISWFAEQTTTYQCNFDGNYGGFGPTITIYEDILGWPICDAVTGHIIGYGDYSAAYAALVAVAENVGLTTHIFWYIDAAPPQEEPGLELMMKNAPPSCPGANEVPPPTP